MLSLRAPSGPASVLCPVPPPRADRPGVLRWSSVRFELRGCEGEWSVMGLKDNAVLPIALMTLKCWPITGAYCRGACNCLWKHLVLLVLCWNQSPPPCLLPIWRITSFVWTKVSAERKHTGGTGSYLQCGFNVSTSVLALCTRKVRPLSRNSCVDVTRRAVAHLDVGH